MRNQFKITAIVLAVIVGMVIYKYTSDKKSEEATKKPKPKLTLVKDKTLN